MNEWSTGYVTDITYTPGYYAELNPLAFQFNLLGAGLKGPKIRTACELGFGLGISTIMHAASQPDTEFWGTDLNPDHVLHAKTLAESTGLPIHLFDQSFAEFCLRDDLPDFDYIGLHGVWSWISDENRAIIVDFVKRKLKVGGGLYVSYNTLPGWTDALPMRHLLVQHTKSMGADGQNIVEKVQAALGFFEKFAAVEPIYLRNHPNVQQRLNQIKAQPTSYVAHEYFNADWKPMHFGDVAAMLTEAKLRFACSAHFPDQLDDLNFNPAQRKLLTEISDIYLRETVKDMIVSRQFRKDYWMRGSLPLSHWQQLEELQQVRVMLICPSDEINLKIQGQNQTADLNSKLYQPLIEVLSNFKPQSLQELQQAVNINQEFNLLQIREACLILAAKGALRVLQNDASTQRAQAPCRQLNQRILEQARSRNVIPYLACAKIGGAIAVEKLEQLFILAINSSKEVLNSEQICQVIKPYFYPLGNRMIKNGAMIESEQENWLAMIDKASYFLSHKYELYRQLDLIAPN